VRYNIISDPDPIVINSDSDAGQSGQVKSKGKGKAPAIPKASDQIVVQKTVAPKPQYHNSFTPINKPGSSSGLKPSSKVPPGSSIAQLSTTPLPLQPSDQVVKQASVQLQAIQSSAGFSNVSKAAPLHQSGLLNYPVGGQKAATSNGGSGSEGFSPNPKSASEDNTSELSDYPGSNLSDLLNQSDQMDLDGTNASGLFNPIDDNGGSDPIDLDASHAADESDEMHLDDGNRSNSQFDWGSDSHLYQPSNAASEESVATATYL
jgi:hypothetical protein